MADATPASALPTGNVPSRLRGKHWLLTWNADPLPEISRVHALVKRFEYYAAQIEVAPSTRRLHWQIYVGSTNSRQFTAIKKLFPGSHIEPAMFPLDAFQYCCNDIANDGKEKEVPDKTSRIRSDAEPPQGRGARTDLYTAVKLAEKEGIRAVHRAHPEVATRYSHHLQRHISMLHPGHAHKDCQVLHVSTPRQVPAGTGYVYRDQNRWFLDDAIDRDAIWLKGPVPKEQLDFLSAPHTWLMNVKGSTYPATFTKIYIVAGSGGGSLVLPAPTSCQNGTPQNDAMERLLQAARSLDQRRKSRRDSDSDSDTTFDSDA